MKRFEFRLERVLEWRQTQLDIELAGLGRLVAEAQAIDRRRADLEAERAAAERSLVSMATVEADELASLDAFRSWATHERERLIRQRAEWEGKIGEQRQRVLEARRKRRLLEILKEKRKAEWTAEFDREMESLAGELYLARRAASAARST
jgi:flagellar FliJ protein